MKIPIKFINEYIEPVRERGDVQILCGIYVHKFKKSISQATMFKALVGGKVSPDVVATVLDYYGKKNEYINK